MLALIGIGVLCRIWRYLLCFPIFLDEAMLCLNLQEGSYLGLTHHLRNCQVAPLLFLWGELTAIRLLGSSEWALRLLPFLGGMGGLFLFWRLARRTLPPLAATLAVGCLAVAHWPVGMCADAKPYALDLFFSALLLLAAVRWLQEPAQMRWLVLLCLVIPVAILCSYPVVFIAGGVSLALLPGVWRRPDWKPLLLWAGFNALLVGSFLFSFLIVARAQLQSPDRGTTTEINMMEYWSHGFPPAAPWAFIQWAVLINTGQMAAFPLGSADGGSSLTVLLCLVGVWRLLTSRQRTLLFLCAAPFALWFLAAAMHRYPYGGSGRLSQHVAPIFCLTAGLGTAVLIERVRSATVRRRWIIGVFGLFVAIGIGGLVRDAIKPYRDLETLWSRTVMREFAAEALSSDAYIVVLNRPEEMDPVIHWYLGLYGDRVHWNGAIDWDQAAACGEIVCLRFWACEHGDSAAHAGIRPPEPATVPPELQVRLEQAKLPLLLTKATSKSAVPHYRPPVIWHMDEFQWELRPQRPETGG
jgi:4-amino-4-deoxy-L-arabinose transferase-like glycosyltransferase